MDLHISSCVSAKAVSAGGCGGRPAASAGLRAARCRASTGRLGSIAARLAEGCAARVDRHAVDAGHDVVAAQAEPLERAVAEQVHHRHAAQLAVVVVHRREARLLRDVGEHLVVAARGGAGACAIGDRRGRGRGRERAAARRASRRRAARVLRVGRRELGVARRGAGGHVGSARARRPRHRGERQGLELAAPAQHHGLALDLDDRRAVEILAHAHRPARAAGLDHGERARRVRRHDRAEQAHRAARIARVRRACCDQRERGEHRRERPRATRHGPSARAARRAGRRS